MCLKLQLKIPPNHYYSLSNWPLFGQSKNVPILSVLCVPLNANELQLRLRSEEGGAFTRAFRSHHHDSFSEITSSRECNHTERLEEEFHF